MIKFNFDQLNAMVREVLVGKDNDFICFFDFISKADALAFNGFLFQMVNDLKIDTEDNLSYLMPYLPDMVKEANLYADAAFEGMTPDKEYYQAQTRVEFTRLFLVYVCEKLVKPFIDRQINTKNTQSKYVCEKILERSIVYANNQLKLTIKK